MCSQLVLLGSKSRINKSPRARTLIELRTLSKSGSNNRTITDLYETTERLVIIKPLNKHNMLLLGMRYLHFWNPRTYILSVKGAFAYFFIWQRTLQWWSIFMNVKRSAVWGGWYAHAHCREHVHQSFRRPSHLQTNQPHLFRIHTGSEYSCTLHL